MSMKLCPDSPNDPAKRRQNLHYTDRSESPKTGHRKILEQVESRIRNANQRTRALDYAPLGESLRIQNHVQPNKLRQISVCGDVYQGFYKTDWTDVSHLQALRQRYPATQQSLARVQGPFPQGFTREELLRNRMFDRSHGSERFPAGMLRVGSQTFFP
jgi:hypothetical protein